MSDYVGAWEVIVSASGTKRIQISNYSDFVKKMPVSHYSLGSEESECIRNILIDHVHWIKHRGFAYDYWWLSGIIETKFLIKRTKKHSGVKACIKRFRSTSLSRTRWWSTRRGCGSRRGTTAASKKRRWWSSRSWRVTRTNPASPHPNRDDHKTKPRATPDPSASGWRRTCWSMGKFSFQRFTNGLVDPALVNFFAVVIEGVDW